MALSTTAKWAAADLLEGNHISPHHRREDGIPEVF